MQSIVPTQNIAIGLAMFAVVAGCTKDVDGPETHPVTGKVTYQGEPASSVTLTFIAASEGANAQAVTNDAGAFEVTTYFDMGKQNKPGMVAGEYRVTAVKLDTESIKTTIQPPRNALPKRYGNPRSSNLSATIVAGEQNQLLFELN